MKFTYTTEELEAKDSTNYLSDYQLITALINERISDLNGYGRLAKRLTAIRKKIEPLQDAKKDI